MEQPKSPPDGKGKDKVNQSTTHTSFMISDILDSTRTPRSRSTSSEDGVDDHTRDASHSPMSMTDQDPHSEGRPEIGEGNLSSDGETDKSGGYRFLLGVARERMYRRVCSWLVRARRLRISVSRTVSVV